MLLHCLSFGRSRGYSLGPLPSLLSVSSLKTLSGAFCDRFFVPFWVRTFLGPSRATLEDSFLSGDGAILCTLVWTSHVSLLGPLSRARLVCLAQHVSWVPLSGRSRAYVGSYFSTLSRVCVDLISSIVWTNSSKVGWEWAKTLHGDMLIKRNSLGSFVFLSLTDRSGIPGHLN